MLNVRERLEALCAGKTLVHKKDGNCSEYKIDRDHLYFKDGDGWDIVTLSVCIFETTDGSEWFIDEEYPLTFFEALKEANSGHTIKCSSTPFINYILVEGALFIKDCPADFYLSPTELKSKWRVVAE